MAGTANAGRGGGVEEALLREALLLEDVTVSPGKSFAGCVVTGFPGPLCSPDAPGAALGGCEAPARATTCANDEGLPAAAEGKFLSGTGADPLVLGTGCTLGGAADAPTEADEVEAVRASAQGTCAGWNARG